MKTILTALAISFSVFSVSATTVEPPKKDGPKIKEVCKEVKAKDGKMLKQCKKIKVHKKLEGTPVPDKKK